VNTVEILAMPGTKLTPRAKVLYIALKELCGKEGSTLASAKELRAVSGLPDKTIQRAVKELSVHGMIRRYRDKEYPYGPWRTCVLDPTVKRKAKA
jgi:DNA-binding MarR family transcriptional regulator